MAVRLILDAVALAATSLAVIVAMFQVEDGQMHRAVLWLAAVAAGYSIGVRLSRPGR